MRQCIALLAALAVAGCGENQSEPGAELLQTANRLPASATFWASVGELTCRPTALDVCGQEKCEPQEPMAYVVWRPSDGRYQRCDKKGCDAQESVVSHSGVYTNVVVQGGAALFKISTDKRYSEIATLGDSVLVYRGSCTSSAGR